MNSIVNKEGKVIAYLYQNVILDIEKKKVIGVLLGNCFFGKSKAPLGKFFKDAFRKKNGKIIGKLGEKLTHDESIKNDIEIIKTAWSSLLEIKDHVCIFIEEKKEWTKKDFIELLTEE